LKKEQKKNRKTKKPPQQWAVLALNTLGEKEEDLDLIIEDIKRLNEKVEVFIPIHWCKDQQFQKKIKLVEGYIFVTGASLPGEYYILESSKYVLSVVSHEATKGRCPDLIPDGEVQTLKKKLQKLLKREFKKEDTVNILDGDYKNLTGMILSNLNEKEVSIQILGIKSADVIVRIQKIFLEKMEEE